MSKRDFVIHMGVFSRQGACAENVSMIKKILFVKKSHVFQLKENLSHERIF